MDGNFFVTDIRNVDCNFIWKIQRKNQRLQNK
jgi:hypothetical protein